MKTNASPGMRDPAVRTETTHASMEELLRELEAERNARWFAVAEAEKHRRFADALARVARAEDASAGLDEFLSKLLELFVELTSHDFAAIHLREGEKLRSRGALGLGEELARALAGSLDEAVADVSAIERRGGLLHASTPADELLQNPLLRDEGIRALHCLPLYFEEELAGAIHLGSRSEHELAEEAQHLLSALAAHASAAVLRQTALESLRQIVLARDEVLGVVAHDLRNPISVITLAASSLHQRVNDPSTRRAIERILRAARRGDHLIRDLLEVSAIEGGRFEIETRRIETATTILTAIESQQGLAASASVILGTDLSP